MFTLGRQKEKEHATSDLKREADRRVMERVIDAVHDLTEGSASAHAVAPILSEAFVKGSSGVWERTGSWLRKLAREHPSLSQLWLQFAQSKAYETRLRTAAFFSEMPDEVRLGLAPALLNDKSAKVRSKTAGEIFMRPNPGMQPLLQNRLASETDPEVGASLRLALAAFELEAA